MSLKLGGSKSKTSSTSNTTTSSTRTPIVPTWASGLTETIAGRVGDAARLDPQSLVAPAHGLQSQAAEGARGLSGMSWNFDGAADLMRGAAQAGPNTYQAKTWDGAELGPAAQMQGASLLDNLDAYMSPYRKDVVDAALADFDFGAGQTRAQLDLDLAGSGAFGGSGAALSRSMTEEALTRGRATTSANLRDQMWSRGVEASNLDAGRRQEASAFNAGAANDFALQRAQLAQQAGLARSAAETEAARYNAGAMDETLQRRMAAAQGLVGLSTAYEANLRDNIATQAALGGALRDIEQQRLQAPLANAQQLVAMLNGLPIELFTGEQTSGTTSTVGSEKTKSSNWSAGLQAADAFKGFTGIGL